MNLTIADSTVTDSIAATSIAAIAADAKTATSLAIASVAASSPIAAPPIAASPIAARSVAVVAVPRRLHLPRGFRREGARLLEQQCWLWGRDVRNPSDNLLLSHGFDRVRPPQGVVGASAYQLRLLADETHARERVIALWGFGIWYGEADESGAVGGIFLGRATFEPRWSARVLPPQNAWSPAPIHAATAPARGRDERRQTRDLLANAMLWIAEYESWALTRMGHNERTRHLEAWPQTQITTVPPDELAAAWRTLALGL